MTTVTGYLRDFGMETFSGLAPRIRFVPSSGTWKKDGFIFATRPAQAVFINAEQWTVEVAATEGMNPTAWYSIQIDWLSAGGEVLAYSEIPGRFHVPIEGGTFGAIAAYSGGVGEVYVGDNVPMRGRFEQFQYNPTTGDLYKTEVVF